MLIQNRYRLLQLIGKGGFCKTYLAVDENQYPPVPCVVQQFSRRNQTPENFSQTAQQLKLLGQHPQIPALLAHFQDEQYCYFVQDFIAGTNLATLLEAEGAFSENQIWQLLANLLPVLKFIHDRKIIHCDIKPENIIRRAAGEFVLVDFAAAQIFSEIDQFLGKDCIGSPEYISPEQVRGKAVFASDLYSLGVICIHLLTQIPPFDLYDVANDCWVWQEYLSTKVSDVWRQDASLREASPTRLRLTQILNKLLSKSISDRFQSADEVMLAMGITDIPHQPVSALPANKWQCIHTFNPIPSVSTGINCVSFSPDKLTLASGDDKIIRLWDLNTQKVLTTLSGHSQAVKSVVFSPDGKILASASDDRTIKLWDIHQFLEICTLVGHSHAVKSVAFSPDGQIIASASWDKTVKLWDVNTGKEISTLSGHKLQVNSVAFSPIPPSPPLERGVGGILASASCDRTIRLWKILNDEVKTETEKTEFKNRPDCTLLGILSGHAWAVLTVAFSPDGKILATGSDDNTIKLWEVNTGQVITTLSGHSWSVVAVTFTADGTMLISASRDRTVKLWRVSTAEEIATLTGHTDSVSTVAVSPDAQLIASGSRDKTIKLWQLVKQGD
ncbi:protein kinase [Calothrix sp. NIES-2100]|uniref:serine/threonine-protein kinase n=1 Tax=Calothrix sp. NIES-2100 TaxID=1954172 RepID=UPI000B609BD2|nr:protein kinase [Calothrix sp. NIES-2100]